MVGSKSLVRNVRFIYHQGSSATADLVPWYSVTSTEAPLQPRTHTLAMSRAIQLTQTRTYTKLGSKTPSSHPATPLPVILSRSAGQSTDTARAAYRSAQGHFPIVPFLLQLLNLVFYVRNFFLSSLDTSSPISRGSFPSTDAVLFGPDATLLGFNFFTDLAFVVYMVAVHDKFQAAGLAGAVLLCAVLTEGTPFGILALENRLIVETHCVDD
jgi:hypothetical protein